MEASELYVIRSRGNTPWFNKPKVYISYYYQNLDLVEKIAETLLVKKDCAIFFYDYSKGDSDEKTLRNILEDIQVFVIPITEEYLTQSHSAKMLELPLANTTNIPQLPLLCSQVSRHAYKTVFGTTHSFRFDPEDMSSLYDNELLSIFLDEFLLEDEQIMKARSAFPFHLFLSYRRHNRPSVLPVMQQIHHGNVCKYVAVWYDKYLTIGKEFDTAIDEKIANCDVFAVLVTQELLEKNSVGDENYVVAYEYPSARASGARILPIEVDAVDPVVLSSKLPGVFCDVSRPVKADNSVVLCKEICRMLPDQAQRISALTREQLYYIGIAYYNGIEVERSYLLARQFFEKAADAGYLKAYDRIAYMYYHGDGVERDVKKAASIQLSVYPNILDCAKSSLSLVDAKGILQAATRCCTYLFGANDATGTSEVCKKAITSLQRLSSKKPGFFNELLGEAYALSGRYALLRGDWDQAIDDCDRAIRVLKRHYRKNGHPDYSKLSGCRQSASIAIKKTGNLQKTEGYLVASLNDLDGKPEEWTEEESSDYANICNSFINLERHYIDYYLDHLQYNKAEQAAQKAKSYYNKAIEIYQRLDSLPVKRYGKYIATLKMDYGLVLKLLCKWKDAEVLLLDSLAAYEKLYAERPYDTSMELARIYTNLGNLYSEPRWALRNIRVAKAYYAKARILYDSYPGKDTITYIEELHKYYYNLTRYYYYRGLIMHTCFYAFRQKLVARSMLRLKQQ